MTQGSTRRTAVFALSAGLAVVDLAVKGIAERAWATTPVDLGVIQLQTSYNRGMAFSVGTALPSWVILTLTATLTTGLAVYLWRETPNGSRPTMAALTAVLAGAAANLVDRARDGAVTDYLHSGWWPTFNLADALIVTGGILTLLLNVRRSELAPPPASEHQPRDPGPCWETP